MFEFFHQHHHSKNCSSFTSASSRQRYCATRRSGVAGGFSILIVIQFNFLFGSTYKGKFHQHSTSSFCACRSWKHKKTDNLNVSFDTFGICVQKSCSKNVDEIDPSSICRFKRVMTNFKHICSIAISYFWGLRPMIKGFELKRNYKSDWSNQLLLFMNLWLKLFLHFIMLFSLKQTLNIIKGIC